MARRRQHRQIESQARNGFEIPDLQQTNAHGCPQKSTDVTAIRQAVRRLGINHDRIETSADTSSLLNNCAPEFSIGGCISVSLFQDGTIPVVHGDRTISAAGTFHTWRDVRHEPANRSQADVDYPQVAHRAVSCRL